jgi:hypothetical protein
MKRGLSIWVRSIIVVIAFLVSCKESAPGPEGTVTIGITDPRAGDTGMRSTLRGIIEPTKLTKFQITISSIQLKQSNEEYVDVLSEAADVDLREFRGTVKELLSVEIPVGSYETIKVGVSAVSITYDGNNYTASTGGGASVTMSAHPGFTFTQADGVPNVFAGGEITFELPLEFELANENDEEGIRLFYDAEPSCYEIPFVCPMCADTHKFAGARPIPYVGVILEEGIQQIYHSPPLGIEPVSETDVDYYGIHTFVDFHTVGGKINAHTSQHVFRGEDGTLTVDAEAMAENSNPLSPDSIAATGTTDIRADETFRCAAIKSNLATAGYTLESGKLYYFSLRKTWNITTNGNTYDLTRMCEPIPVLWP